MISSLNQQIFAIKLFCAPLENYIQNSNEIEYFSHSDAIFHTKHSSFRFLRSFQRSWPSLVAYLAFADTNTAYYLINECYLQDVFHLLLDCPEPLCLPSIYISISDPNLKIWSVSSSVGSPWGFSAFPRKEQAVPTKNQAVLPLNSWKLVVIKRIKITLQFQHY